MSDEAVELRSEMRRFRAELRDLLDATAACERKVTDIVNLLVRSQGTDPTMPARRTLG